MGWCMNHRGTSVHFVPKESTNTQGQTICRGTLPHSIGITTTSEADSSLLDMFVSITWIKIQMTPSCAKYLRKDVRAVAGVDEGALGADKISATCILSEAIRSMEYTWTIPRQTRKST